MTEPSFCLVEATIAQIRTALETGRVTSVELVHAYLNRIAFYDRHGIRLNAVPVLNPHAFDEAAASDARRRAGRSLGPLDGIPYTAKDSYRVAGLTVAAGSPAFEHLVAGDDAFTIARLRAAGAILLGLTNMPPMAGGGMQRGVYGRAESPYSEHFLTAAYGSGSSNGSGTATAASFAAFGLGEETWSSGRAPASNNALVAYTPSRGVISMRGNWPLFATMDVVVPHTRTVDDLLDVLNVIVADDPQPRGDFWRAQPYVSLPRSSEVRPEDYRSLRTPDALTGKRIGVPRMYINKDPGSDRPIETRASVIALWEESRTALESQGAEVIEVDFPAVSNYEKDRPGTRTMYERGLVPQEFLHTEMWPLVVHTWNDFLAQNGDPAIASLDDVDGEKIFPIPPGALPDRYEDDPDMAELAALAREIDVPRPADLPHLEEGLSGLEATRRIDFEDWLDASGLDMLVFPAAADVGPYDADYNPVSNDLAWKNGVTYSNGNLVIRHLGIPTVTVPMGVMADTRMPVGLTFAGRAYDDNALLSAAYAFEQAHPRRVPPPRTPACDSDTWHVRAPLPRQGNDPAPEITLDATLSPMQADGSTALSIRGRVGLATSEVTLTLSVNGEPVTTALENGGFSATVTLPPHAHYVLHSPWRAPYGSLITLLARDRTGLGSGLYTVVGGVG
ncbi:amidase [Streptomyces albicerus]|uniref:amidase n=1 Tax=Streptomyces albicerus TaxID=2569859 RepID=UPI00124B6EB8|nr:amidase [Streptomyces albicerus]